MKVDILIDKLTPCLVEVASGKVLQTTFSLVTRNDLAGLKRKGWLFDWTDEELRVCNIYKLQIKGDNVIQGLVAAEVYRGAVYVSLVESAPQNKPPNKKYEGVGGHLFAIAIKLSAALGFGGYVFLDAKNTDLVKHYSDMLGAVETPTRFHEYRMEVLEDAAQKVLETYTLEGDLNVE
jgi:hypothetical protein